MKRRKIHKKIERLTAVLLIAAMLMSNNASFSYAESKTVDMTEADSTEETKEEAGETKETEEEETRETEETEEETEETEETEEETEETEETEEEAGETEETEEETGETEETEEETGETEETEEETGETEETEEETGETEEAEEETGETEEEAEETGETEETEEEAGVLVSDPISLDSPDAPGGGSADLGTYTQSLFIYNYLYYSNPDNSAVVMRDGSSGLIVLSGESNVDVVIGADTEAEASERKPMANDIEISLSELTMSDGKTMTVKTVYFDENDEAAGQVRMSVSKASAVSSLILEEGASLYVSLEADLEISALTLGESGRIEFALNGHTLTIKEASGTGDVNIGGSGTVTGQELSCQNLSVSGSSVNFTGKIAAAGNMELENASVDGGGTGTVSALGDITARTSTVQNAVLFGYTEEAEGEAVMEFTDCTFSGIATVGAASACQAQVFFAEGSSVSTESNVGYVRDYRITYLAGETELLAQSDWLISYRVSSDAFAGGTTEILGGSTAEGYLEGAKTLPSYTEEGYGYGGWTVGEEGEPITELTGQTKDLTLYAVLAAGTVTVTMDLGFVPSADNSDDYEELLEKYTVSSDDGSSVLYSDLWKLGDTLELDDPERFGYLFRGWKICPEEGEPGESYTDSYTIQLSDLTKTDGEQNQYALRMEAQWEEDTFPVNLTFSGIELEYMQVSLDGGESWGTVKEILAKNPYWIWDSSSQQLKTSGPAAYIRYGETMGAYFARLGEKYPQVRDSRSLDEDVFVAAQAKSFLAWSAGTQAVSETSVFDTGDILTGKGSNSTWEEYASSLKVSPVTFITNWGTMNYSLTVPEVSNWSYYIDQTLTIPEDGVIEVPGGATVTFAVKALAAEPVSVWGITAANGTSLYMQMRRYSSGDSSYYYDFVMPASSVTAVYENGGDGNPRYIDIAKSPITFAEDISYNGRTGISGFWYKEAVPDVMMPLFCTDDTENSDAYASVTDGEAAWYFYEYDFKDNFYVTSNGVQTQNQLTLVNAVNVYLKNCYLAATDGYSAAFSGRTINGTSMEVITSAALYTAFGKEGSLSSCGSIVIDNSSNYKYTTNLYIVGDNQIASILQSKLNTYANYYGELNVYGNVPGEEGGALSLGSIFVNGTALLSDLAVREYENEQHPDNSEYLIWSVGSSAGLGNITVKNSTVDAKDKYINSNYASVIISGTSRVKIGNLYGAQNLQTVDTSYTRVYGNVMTYRGLSLSGSSSLVIDGNLIAVSHGVGQAETSRIATGGYLIVKGNRCEFQNFSVSNGTIIANDVSAAYQGTMSGGTIITNHLMNYAVSNPTKQSDGTYTYSAVTTQKTTPFCTWSNTFSEDTKYTFSGGELYLFGHYKANGDLYDLTAKATDADNPVAAFIEPLLDENGDLASEASAPDGEALKAAVSAESVANGNLECVILGNSEYNSDTRRRTVYISGSSFYAAGNVNFFNDVNISGGTVECAGDLSSALDLTISDGTVRASGVGNSSDLSYTDGTTKMTRWHRTVISGGSVSTDRLGALYNTKDVRSTLDIRGGTLTGISQESVQLVHDVYINYVIGTEFTNPSENPETVRFAGVWTMDTASFADVEFHLVDDSLGVLSDVTLSAPETADGTGSWRLDSLSGSEADKIGADGTLTGGGAQIRPATAVLDEEGAARESLSLYAVKDTYRITVPEGYELVDSVLTGDEEQSLDGNHSVGASPGTTAVIRLKDGGSMKDQTVVWYYDAAGLLHNADPRIEESGGNTVISFDMPAADVEVFATEELTLYLDLYEILFLEDGGFRAEFEPSREDSDFSYGGSYRITQSNLLDSEVTAREAAQAGSHPTVRVDGTVITTTTGSDKLTKNRLKFEGSNMDGERNISYKIILEKVLQDYATSVSTSSAGLIAGESGAVNVAIGIDGVNQLCVTDVYDGSQIYFYGVHENEDPSADTYEDKLCIQSRGFNRWDMGFVSTGGNTGRAAGNAYFKDLNIMQLGNIFSIAKSFSKNKNSTVTLENCRSRTLHYYAGSGIVAGYGTANLINCVFEMEEYSDTSSPAFNNTDTVNIEDTKISYKVGGGRNGHSLFNGITSAMNIGGSSEITIRDIYTTAQVIRNVNDTTSCTVTLTDSASVTADRRLRLSRLILGETSDSDSGPTFTVTGPEGGYLFCPDITVNSGTLTADYVINSGYNTTSSTSVATVQTMLVNGTDMMDGGLHEGLTVNGGTVNVSEFAGGSCSSRITVTGGTLCVKNAGTTDTRYGIAYYTPMDGEEYVYTYTNMPVSTQGAVIAVSGGTVNVLADGCLGGLNAAVAVSGGTVNLEGGAVLGITEEQKTALANYYSERGENIASHTDSNIKVTVSGGRVEGESGSIYTPYGKTSVSGTDTLIKVGTISARNGSVTISEASGETNGYANGITAATDHKQVGVYAAQLLTAQEIYINNGAVVYAKEAVADADRGNNGILAVGPGADTEMDYLYAGTYGSAGEGSVTITGEEYIYGSQQYSIHYHLRDDETDPAVNAPENPAVFAYAAGSSDSITLYAPSRSGYEFMGWYESEEKARTQLKEDKVSAVLKSIAGDVELYAGWKPLEVTFRIVIENVSDRVDNLSGEIADLGADAAVYDETADVLTFSKTVSVAYLDFIFGSGDNRITLSDFALPSYTVESLEIAEEGWSGSGTLSQLTSVVTKKLLEFYLEKKENSEDAEIRLRASLVAKKNQKLTMDLNLNDQKRPVDAVFAKDSNSENQPNASTATTISSYAFVGSTVSGASGFVIGGELNRPAAPGYTFDGWYTDKDCAGEPINADYGVGSEYASVFYAKWTPNEYGLEFDAGEGGVITKTKDEPSEAELATMTAYVTYDERINGNLTYTKGEKGSEALPCAWKSGSVFLGWSADGGTTLIDRQELNLDTFAGLDLSEESETAIRLTAVYRSVQITYMTEGGVFTDSWENSAEGRTVAGGFVQTEAVYGEPLAGYSRTEESADYSGYEAFGAVETDGIRYQVLSTTSAAYAADQSFGAYDYRNEIGRKGYTFQGWYTASGDTAGAVPRYADIVVYARWKANQYTLNLNPAKSEYSETVGGETSAPSATVVVGEEIRTNPPVNVDAWPDRTGWYAYDKDLNKEELDESSKRYILGFAFDSFEPGASSGAGQTAYNLYANYVLSLVNSGCLYTKAEGETKGSIFALPSDTVYSSAVYPGTVERAVPDYPDGSSIDMYAVYRERSLVFVERYVDTDSGDTVQTVLYSAPYYSYDDYPERIYQSSDRKAKIESQGYTLTGWYINSISAASGREYTEDAYTKNVDEWLSEAKNIGTYDIMVYTVYAAQATKTGLWMAASASPVAESGTATSCVVPNSMSPGTISYTVQPSEGLSIVGKDELDRILYSKDQANMSAAVFVELIDSSGTVQESFWLDKDGGTSAAAIGAGWRIRMTLYHSHVISEEKTLTFDMILQFDGEGLEAQKLTLEQVEIDLKPTKWTVNYTAVLPGDDCLAVNDESGFEKAEDEEKYLLRDSEWIYGTALQAEIPKLEGYDGIGSWKYSDAESYGYGAAGTMTLSAENQGIINLSTDYNVKDYRLSADDGVLERWTVSYGSGASPDELKSSSSQAAVNYHEIIAITPNGAQEAAYIRLIVTGTDAVTGDEIETEYRLDQLTDEENKDVFHGSVTDGVYRLLMPAGDVALKYSDVRTLYLEDGTIRITENGYTQDGVTDKEVAWPGDYVILQNADNDAGKETSNVITLEGNLDGRTIELGNLNISGEDSVALSEGTTVRLTAGGTFSGKNILVPDDAALHMTSGQKDGGETVSADITLVPSVGKAAVGGSGAACGTIVLTDLNLALTMPAGSSASGIGSGSSSGGGTAVTLSDCTVAVTEEASQSAGAYKGVWLGGRDVTAVSLQNTTVVLAKSSTAGTIADGTTVALKDSRIGSVDNSIADHTVRGGSLYIDGSSIFLEASVSGDAQGSSPLLPAENVISVDKDSGDGSTVYINGTFRNLYNGVMMLYSADSDVYIGHTQIVDVKNGDAKITDSRITQGAVSHEHDGSYLLLSEFSDYDGSSDVTVISMKAGTKITAGADDKDTVEITDLTVGADTDLTAIGAVKVTGTTAVSDGMTLTAEVPDSGSLEFDSGFDIEGSYAQKGGSLGSGGDLIVGGDLTLTDVTADVSGHKAGSSGQSGVTAVTLAGGSIRAETIGALGRQNDTFTFVALEDTPAITGTVVRDHYRLNYILNDANFDCTADQDGNALPAVLRSSAEYTDGTAKDAVYSPKIPNDPKYTGEGESYFGNWYIVNEAGTNTALSENTAAGFTEYTMLNADLIDLASATDPEDGTNTLDIYGWLEPRGSALISYGRVLNAMPESEDADTVRIESNGAWTVRFTAEGAAVSGSEYQFDFDKALPAGTKLTLADRSEEAGIGWYYYVVPDEGATRIPLGSFVRMGTDDVKAEMSSVDPGTAYTACLQLSADFADTQGASDSKVKLVLKLQETEQDVAEAGFTVAEPAGATVTGDADSVSVKIETVHEGHTDSRLFGQHVYLVAKLSRTDREELSVPYAAALTLEDGQGGGRNGIWIGGDKVFFDLGEYGNTDEKYTWTVSGLDAGSYAVVWSLTTAGADSVNVAGKDAVLAVSDASEFTVSEKEEPSLAVTLVNVDGGAVSDVLSAGSTHTALFTYRINAQSVTVTVEKQTALKRFRTVESLEGFDSGREVSIPSGSGTYRVRFSISENSVWDDVYYTFIVK